MTRSQRIFVAGHRGMVGSAIVRRLSADPDKEVITASRAELDLRDSVKTQAFLNKNPIDCLVIAAAKVGGIHANNTYPADFLYDNLMMECNLIHAAHGAGVQRILFLGSSCIYPRMAPQPMPESCLLTGELEKTNEAYAIAKIAGIKLCESFNRQYGTDYRSLMPTNLYGPQDNFHPTGSHVIPGLIRRIHEAKLENAPSVTIWGTGTPMREFLHVDDLADATVHVMNLDHQTYWDAVSTQNSHVNVGTGEDVTIAELAATLVTTIGFQGEIVFDTSKLDGTPRKLLDVSLLNRLGWRHKIELSEGLQGAYQWYVDNIDTARH